MFKKSSGFNSRIIQKQNNKEFYKCSLVKSLNLYRRKKSFVEKITNAQGTQQLSYAKAMVETKSLIKTHLQSISNEFN